MKLFFEMQIVDDGGKVHGKIRQEISRDAAFMGTREVDMLRLGVSTFDNAVRMMQVREVRKKLLTRAAANAGAALAEHLEDREGWHGVDRAERVQDQYGQDFP